MNLSKGKQPTTTPLLQSVQLQRGPQTHQLGGRVNSNLTLVADDYPVQRPLSYQQPVQLRTQITAQPVSANSNNPHDMNKQQLTSQPGLPVSSVSQVNNTLLYAGQQINPHGPGSFFQRPNARSISNVQQRPTMNVNVNPATNPNSQQPHYYGQMSPSLVPLPGMANMQTPMYLGGVSQVSPYRPAFPPQQSYPMPSQGQPVYLSGGTNSYSGYTHPHQSSHNPAVYYQVPMRQTVPVMGAGQPTQPLKREKKIIRIQDPNTERDVTHEIIGSECSSSAAMPPVLGSSTSRDSTPSSSAPVSKNNEIAMQFATQVAVAAAEPATKEHMMLPPCSRTIAPSEKFPEADETKTLGKCSNSENLGNLSDTTNQRPLEAKVNNVLQRNVQFPCVSNVSESVVEKKVEPSKPGVKLELPDSIPAPFPIQEPPKTETFPSVAADVSSTVASAPVIEEENEETPVSEEVSEVLSAETITPEQKVTEELQEAQKPIESFDKLPEPSKQVPHENGEIQDLTDVGQEKWEQDAKDMKKQKGRKKGNNLNRKGESKEGGDMDAFVDKEEVTPTIRPINEEQNSAAEDLISKEEQRKVAEKNEENTKVSQEFHRNDLDNPVIEDGVTKSQSILKYTYKEDQWSPLNPEGKRHYDRAFLLHMQSQPMSLKKPEGLPDLEIIKDTANNKKPFENRPSNISGITRAMSQVPDFTPGYVKSTTPRGQPQIRGGRSSQQGKIEPKAKKNFSFAAIQDIKLSRSSNAWKPSCKQPKEVIDPNAIQTEELYKKVRSILNKLTPQKFQTLVNQVNSLLIDTEERLKGVIDLVFEKAIDEPNFSVAYANLCKCLAMMKVPLSNKENDYVNFRKLLLNKCQKEFEKDLNDEVDRENKIKDISQSESVREEKKKELIEEYEEIERKAKRRSLGNIRFIGELFKLHMLTANIMHDCLKKLLSQEDEDSLECLCRLLTTIGKDMESDKNKGNTENKMNVYFTQMQEIVHKKQTSSRVRFMLQDVIDLRSGNWIPRRDENNPKTIDQIHQEAEREAYEREALLQQMSSHRRSDDRDKRKRNNAGTGLGASGDDGWNTVPSKNSTRIDGSKIKLSKPVVDDDIQLGPGGRISVGGWGRGSSGGSRTGSQEMESKASTPTNRFQALSAESSSIDSRRGANRAPTPSGRDSSKGRGTQIAPTAQRNIKPTSTSREREQVIAAVKTITGSEPGRSHVPEDKDRNLPTEEGRRDSVSSNPMDTQLLGSPDISEDEMERRTKSIIDEFLHNNDFKEAAINVCSLCSHSTVHLFVTNALNLVMERSTQARLHVGQLTNFLVKEKIILVEQYIKGLEGISSMAEEYAIDIPHFWGYLAELIVPITQSGTIPLSYLREIAQPCVEAGLAGKLISEVLHALAKNMGTQKVGEMWRNSNLTWAVFLSENQNQEKFITENRLDFTIARRESLLQPQMSLEEIKEHLTNILQKKKADNEVIFDWIDSHVTEAQTKEFAFVRALMTAIVQGVLEGTGTTWNLQEEALRKRCTLLLKYLDHKDEFELQALYALQALMHQMEQPKSILCQIFDTLYDEDVISEEAFLQWESSDDPAEQEGKGVALSSVRTFYTWLREMDNESPEES